MSFRKTASAALALLLLVFAMGPSLHAQTEVRAQLDRMPTEITALEKEVQANLTNDKGLVVTRAKLEPLQNQLRVIVAEQTPILEGIKARLDQLGPRPDAAKGQTENADVAREREEQEKAQRDTEGLLALARNHLVAIEQMASRITDQRRTLLTRALLERTDSIFSPLLWVNIMRALPGEFRSLQYLFAGWFEHLQSRLDGWRLGFLALAALILGIVAVPGHRYLRRFEARPAWPPEPQSDGQTFSDRPTRKQRALAALRVTIIWAVVPIIVCAGIYSLLQAMDLITERMDGFVHTLLFGIALVAFAHGLADGILGPDDPAWRLADLDDRSASKIANLAKAFPTVIVIGKTLEALMQAIYAVLPVTVGGKALVALLGAFTIIRTLRGLRSLPEAEADDGAKAPSSGGLFTLVRLLAWAAAGIMLLAVALGYVALGSFIQDQIIWLAMVGGVLVILVALVDEYIGYGISPAGKFGRQVMQEVGLSKGSLTQISILANGFFRVVLFIAAAMLALAPWGLDGGDTLGTLRAALFGFTVGGVTISLSNIILAIVLFGIGFSITKAVKVWLEKSYLPHTKLDIGLRNSIATSIGYLGIIIATIMAASTLGFSLDKFTIVAGALSVGIGFGLQSIVNNFVSGLILLWERPIRVGDWIVVGDEQGIVKRINVRSTQIETFDRASLIVPNSEFISGRVKNWMHNDRTARVVIPIGVGYGSDPDRVRKILLDVAKASKDVLREPVPRVYFMRLGETSMDFELRCFTDVDSVLPTKSELLFQIHKQLSKARIDIPMPRRPREWLEPEREEGDSADGNASRSSGKGA